MGALKVGVLFYAQVGEPFQFLAEPALVGSGRDFQHGGDRPGLVGVHWQVRGSGDQRDVAAEVMAVDPGSHCWEVLCGHQQIAGQGPDDGQDGPLPPAVLGRDVQQFPDVLEPFDGDPGTVGDEPPPLVGIVGDVAGLLRHPVKFCLQLGNGRRETHLLADLVFVILGELAEIIGMFSCLLSEDDPQQLQIATGAGQHLTECFQPGSHGDAARLNTALLLLGSVDLLTDQARLVVTGSCERVERAALCVFCLACACLSTLQVLFGLG